ncbi:sensor histidine kinase [Blastococcus sp. SYSU D00669]
MSGMARRWRALPLQARDGLLALVLTVVGQVELLVADEVAGPRPLQHVAFAVITLSLVARRSRPLAATVTGAAGLAFQTVVGEAPVVAGFAALLVLTYSVAQYADSRRDAVLGLVVVLASVAVYPFVAEEVSAGDEVANLAIPAIIWVFARLARERLDRAVLAERAAQAARERVREGERAREAALAAERRRIAREMHDVVGHGVTLMLLHADAAQAALQGREPAAARALDVVLTAGRTALDDLHRLLRVLREETAEPPGTLADLDRLLAAARATGVDARLVVEGGERPLPAGVEATASRVVREAVTNVLKHAAAGRLVVRLRYGEDELGIEVTDDGSGAGGGPSAGLGLAGLRERVALFDGRLTAGPRADGAGWRVAAVLPVPAAVAA